MKLVLSKELSVPIDIVTEAVAWIGARGSGKTHGAGKLVELLVGAQVPVIVLDPVGVWYGLRLAKDGKGRGLSIPVFGGLHGDVPLEPTAGALIADLIVDKNLSAIIDVSQFDTDAQKARFTSDFAQRLFARKKKDPAVIHWVIDEAQEFVPQNPQPGEQMMLHNVQRVLKLGRNFGIGVSLLTQRPQETSKKALNQCQTVLAFRVTGPQERKAMKEWIAAHDLDHALLEKLPSLPTGTCQVWSPAFMKVNMEIRILPKDTFDASATPKFGQHRATRELAPIDLDKLRDAMKATVEKAKAEDPKVLRQQIAELRALVGKQPAVAFKEKVVEKRVEVSVLKEADIKRLESAWEKCRIAGVEIMERFKKTREVPARVPVITRTFPVMEKLAPMMGLEKMFTPITIMNGDISRPQQRILNALAALQNWGVNFPDRRQVALLSQQSPSSSGYANNLSALKTAGLISYPQGGVVALTHEGSEVADYNEVGNQESMRSSFLARLPRPQAAILSCLIEKYPTPVGRSALALASGQSESSSGYANNLSALKSLGVIEYPRPGEVRAAEILFIKEKVTA